MAKKQSDYIIYTDGGCAYNPGGPGGCAAVIINQKTGEKKSISEGYLNTTNNRMEMRAVLLALQNVKAKRLTIYSDSEYVIKTMNGEFSRKKNQDLWAKIAAAKKGKSITWRWVRGHNGNQHNEECDELCTLAMQQPNLRIDDGYNGRTVSSQGNKPIGGAMGVLIEIPESFLDQDLSISSVKEYMEDYQVQKKCAEAILDFAKSSRHVFKSYIAIKTDGIDYWSRKSRKQCLNIWTRLICCGALSQPIFQTKKKRLLPCAGICVDFQ